MAVSRYIIPTLLFATAIALSMHFIRPEETVLDDIQLGNLQAYQATTTEGKINLFQEEMIARFGQPMQIRRDGTLSNGLSASEVLGLPVPTGIESHIYEARDGSWGYQIIQYATSTQGNRTITEWRSIGTGLEAAERTWDWRQFSEWVASST